MYANLKKAAEDWSIWRTIRKLLGEQINKKEEQEKNC